MRQQAYQQIKHERRLAENIPGARPALYFELYEYIGRYSAPDCQALCERVQQKLPRELRDMIYGYILNPRPRRGSVYPSELIAATPVSKAWKKPVVTGTWMTEFDARDILHICSSQFLGAKTIQELAETYYRLSKFYFFRRYNTLDDIETQLHDFFASDMWGLNLVLYDHVKQVELAIFGIPTDELVTTKAISETMMKSLLRLNKGAKITIAMSYPDWNPPEGLREWLKALSLSFPAFGRLVDNGQNVTFNLKNGSIEFRIKKQELTVECWERKFRGYGW